ncbi:MAG: response regulator [Deltaproteobacteria bacterium]|nr:response regulator [Deltaproteobacteria bacterium]
MPKKILIVDDDPDIILFLSTVLKDNGYQTINAMNGREGLEMIESEHPDLILLDLMMPKKSGLSLLSDLKRDSVNRQIPVIMVTGVSSETGHDLASFFKGNTAGNEECKAIIPEGYLEKPIDPEKLLGMVKGLLKPD